MTVGDILIRSHVTDDLRSQQPNTIKNKDRG